MEPDACRLPPHSWKPSSQEAGNHSFSRAVESACMTQLSYMALTIYSTHGATGLTATEHDNHVRSFGTTWRRSADSNQMMGLEASLL